MKKTEDMETEDRRPEKEETNFQSSVLEQGGLLSSVFCLLSSVFCLFPQ